MRALDQFKHARFAAARLNAATRLKQTLEYVYRCDGALWDAEASA